MVRMKLKTHPVAEIFPMMGKSELKELADDIRANGLEQAVVIQGDVLLDGRNRLAACEMAGVKVDYREYEGDNPVAFIISSNIHRRHLTESQRAMVAVKLANMRQGERTDKEPSPNSAKVSQKQAATLLNVGVSSVKDAKVVADASPELMAQVLSGDITVNAAKQQVRPHVANNSGNNEWYTPKEYIEAARRVMGVIDLDPASSKEANGVVKASKFYTEKDNGLKADWKGRVWMNPPYASDLVGKFIEKLAVSMESGEVTEALVLVNNATDTKWFARLASISKFLCFPTGRVRFWKTGKKSAAPLQGQCVAYIGKHYQKFVDDFCQFGMMVEIIHERR